MQNKEKKIKSFDPNSPGDTNNNIFGLPFNEDEADVVIYPVPWEVTVSYTSGTASGPQAVYDASYQVDLYDGEYTDGWKKGIAMTKFPRGVKTKNLALRKFAERYIALLHKGESPKSNNKLKTIQTLIDKECEVLNKSVKNACGDLLDKGKLVGLLGGDHSTPLGLLQALAERNTSFGILQIDAHADLRKAYEGFKYSHASIMYNALKIDQVKKLVQVGIRDYCDEEAAMIKRNAKRISCFTDRELRNQMYSGKSWKELCRKIVKTLPENVYISFDIDGLDPKLCPNTGTPVPGGLEFEQATFLIDQVVKSKRKIIGFDLNEVAPGKDEWDANVGARLLYRMALMASKSNG